MQKHKIFDVAIVGAGPAGSYLAWKLAGKGYDVTVLEEHNSIGEPVNCTGIIGLECFKKFPLSLNSVLRASNSACFYSPSGKEIILRKDEDQAYIVDRRAFDVELARKAREAGATFLTGRHVVNIEVKNGGVKISSGNGTNSVEAKVTVIASGFNSMLSEHSGLSRIAKYAFGCQVEVNLAGAETIEVYFGNNIAPDFFAWLVPTFSGKGLAGLFSSTKQAAYLRNFLNTLRSQGKICGETGKAVFGGVPLGMIRKSYADRILALGDAAGQVKPTTGGGIYYGLLCADIAAGTIDQALQKDNFSAGNLREYESAWKGLLGREIQTGQLARNIFQRLSDSQIDRAFDIIKKTGFDKIILEDKNLSFDWQASTIVKALGHHAFKSLWNKMGLETKRLISKFAGK